MVGIFGASPDFSLKKRRRGCVTCSWLCSEMRHFHNEIYWTLDKRGEVTQHGVWGRAPTGVWRQSFTNEGLGAELPKKNFSEKSLALAPPPPLKLKPQSSAGPKRYENTVDHGCAHGSESWYRFRDELIYNMSFCLPSGIYSAVFS